MTIEPRSWTLNTEAIESNHEWGQEWFLPKIDIMVREGVLVLDTRLQAIADAHKCKHELIDRHQAYILNADLTQKYHPNGAAVWEWCEGAPELRALLDALTKADAE